MKKIGCLTYIKIIRLQSFSQQKCTNSRVATMPGIFLLSWLFFVALPRGLPSSLHRDNIYQPSLLILFSYCIPISARSRPSICIYTREEEGILLGEASSH
jgi:hypothetical protein